MGAGQQTVSGGVLRVSVLAFRVWVGGWRRSLPAALIAYYSFAALGTDVRDLETLIIYELGSRKFTTQNDLYK